MHGNKLVPPLKISRFFKYNPILSVEDFYTFYYKALFAFMSNRFERIKMNFHVKSGTILHKWPFTP